MPNIICLVNLDKLAPLGNIDTRSWDSIHMLHYFSNISIDNQGMLAYLVVN